MATRQLLAELVADYKKLTNADIAIESVGGVDAAKRVQAGEAFDVVVLASDAIDKLIAAGHVQQGSRVDWVLSPVAVAIKAGAKKLDISSDIALKAAVLASSTIGYSTGPSGTYLSNLFGWWGISDEVNSKLIKAPPGVPVGSLVANGEIALGFQQLSELLGLEGIEVLGTLPREIACITTFSTGIPIHANPTQLQAIRDFQAFLSSSGTEEIKNRLGMTWHYR